ncbi:MAG TPA: tetrahydrofolate dehydrogenase/cyclohydrolase catalytic domain-containing protein [Armatimonadota bacterium]|nr:tetrahydrofolate dehydrogenase/cyclohydrolase catalytic domain-containing protein [Armatimonadota bacterium]
MAAEIISGKAVAGVIKDDLRRRVAALSDRGVTPGLAAILVGEHPSSVVYVGLKERDCASVGVRSMVLRMPESCSQAELISLIRELNGNPEVHGILLQHPLPADLDEDAAVRAIKPEKDIDGVTPASFGALVVGRANMVSPTALGAMALLKSTGVPIAGKHAVVLGRSSILGKPAAWLLLQENATVTICHSRTVDLPSIIRQGDILFAAINRAEFVRGEHIKPGAVVIDCGYERVPGRKGDVGAVEFESASKIAGWISPVPGGVGPAGRAMLVANCVRAAEISLSA